MQEWHDADGWHIDVRRLSAPEPLVRILRRVAQLTPAEVLIVHHDRDPLMLYPELVQIGWWAEVVDGAPGEVRLRISKS